MSYKRPFVVSKVPTHSLLLFNTSSQVTMTCDPTEKELIVTLTVNIWFHHLQSRVNKMNTHLHFPSSRITIINIQRE